MNFLPTKKIKIRQVSDFSPAILEAKVFTDYVRIKSATQEPSTNQENQSELKRKLGLAVTEKINPKHA